LFYILANIHVENLREQRLNNGNRVRILVVKFLVFINNPFRVLIIIKAMRCGLMGGWTWRTRNRQKGSDGISTWRRRGCDLDGRYYTPGR